MKNILCLEIDEKLFKDLEDLDKKVQKLILRQMCVNCKKPAKGRIEYVLCTNGEVRFWHYRVDGLVESCAARKRVALSNK